MGVPATLLKKSIAPLGAALFVGGFVAFACEFMDIDLSEEPWLISSICMIFVGVLLSTIGSYFVKKMTEKKKSTLLPQYLGSSLGDLLVLLGIVMLIMNRLNMNTADMDDWVKFVTIGVILFGFFLWGGGSFVDGLLNLKGV